MILIPALDLKDGKTVQLVGGVFGSEQVVINDIKGTVEKFYASGIRRLHIIDLDAAKDAGDNLDIIIPLLKSKQAPIEIGGGVRSLQKAKDLIDAGADYVIVGTKAVKDPEFLKQLAQEVGKDKIVVSLDYKQGKVLVKGWDEATNFTPIELIGKMKEYCDAFLMTCVDVEGQLKGSDKEYLAEVIQKTGAHIIASGGINSHQDLQSLADVGVFGAVVGMALYKGHINLDKVVY